VVGSSGASRVLYPPADLAFSFTRTALVVGSSGASRVLYPPADLVVTVSFQSLAETNRSTSAAIKSGIPGCIQ
jgi:hypothetical protein